MVLLRVDLPAIENQRITTSGMAGGQQSAIRVVGSEHDSFAAVGHGADIDLDAAGLAALARVSD